MQDTVHLPNIRDSYLCACEQEEEKEKQICGFAAAHKSDGNPSEISPQQIQFSPSFWGNPAEHVMHEVYAQCKVTADAY